ncbi:MAG: prepilin-type N-terminal cleavage/methylation domain-containing protein [Acidimicrobiales bacterium]
MTSKVEPGGGGHVSLFVREEALRRQHGSAAPLLGRLAARLRVSRGNEGFGIIEMVVSLAIFAIVALPITHIIVTTEASSNNLHLRAEATDLATQALESAQYKTQNGVNPTAGTTTGTQYSGGDKFTVAVSFTLAPGTGTSSSICIAPPGQLSSQIWKVTATATWGAGGQNGQVIETTLVSPAQVDLADTNAAEIAVPIFTALDNPNSLEVAASVSMTITGTCTLTGGCGSVPGNETTGPVTSNSGSSGCVVFTGLYAGTGEEYSISVTPPSGYVDPNEYFWNSSVTSYTFYTQLAPPANQVDVVSNPQLVLAQAAPVTVNFSTVGGTTTNMAPDIPVSVNSATLNCANQTCILGDGVTGLVSSGASVQLFPGTGTAGTSVAVPSVTTTSGSTSAGVASGGFPGVSTGWDISGTGIPTGDTVLTISSNTLTMSVAATASATGTLTFLPPPNYTAWAGDAPDSAPGSGNYGTSLQPVGFQAFSGTAVTITLPLYPLLLNVQLVTAQSGTVTGMQVADSSGGDTMNLIGSPGFGSVAGSPVNTGLPLGQYQLAAAGTGSNDNVYYGGSSPTYVWVIATGVCVRAGSSMTSCTSSSANYTAEPTAITVTVG